MEPNLTIPQLARLIIFVKMLWFEPRVAFSLTSPSDAMIYRDYIDADRQQFDQIVHSCYKQGFIEISIEYDSAIVKISKKGEDLAEGRISLF
jgi:hypothetical protein